MKFPDRIISRKSGVNWQPRSCDLTPLDCFLWECVKDQVYANNPQFIQVLKTNNRPVIGEIEQRCSMHLCKDIIENFDERIDTCKYGHGGHLSNIIFLL